jgi:hypothetical protein
VDDADAADRARDAQIAAWNVENRQAAPNEPEAAGESGSVVTPYSLALAPRIKLSSRSNIAEQFTNS